MDQVDSTDLLEHILDLDPHLLDLRLADLVDDVVHLDLGSLEVVSGVDRGLELLLQKHSVDKERRQ